MTFWRQPFDRDLISGNHYVDCYYIDASRKLDGLWDGLEKVGRHPDCLLLEWCSATEGAHWQNIMKEAEKKRQSVTAEELELTRSTLVEAKMPSPRNHRPKDEGREAGFVCMRCGHEWHITY